MKKMVNGGWSNHIKTRADHYGICLCNVDELPPWHFSHRGIRHGYRYCRSFSSAIISTLYWHNETINVWSHIIASILILLYFFFRWPEVVESEKGTDMDKIVLFFVVVLGNVMPLLSSAICHNFYCINQATHKYCWFLDFCGILTGMFICGLGYIYFAFYCSKTFVAAMSILLIVLFCVTVAWCWHKYSPRMDARELTPRDRFPEFSFSLSSYVTVASFIPIALTWIYQEEYYLHDKLYEILVHSTISPLLLSVGVIAFAQGGIPERFFKPNVLDLAGHSHQLWHLVTAVVMFKLVASLMDHFHTRADYGCSF